MKKLFAIVAVLALLLPVLAGCASTPPTDTPAGNAQQGNQAPQGNQAAPGNEASPASADAVSGQTPAADPDAAKYISRDEAIAIALKDAGLSVSDVRELEAELDRDDGKLHYDVGFESGGYDYDYEIDAVSGKILKNRKERD